MVFELSPAPGLRVSLEWEEVAGKGISFRSYGSFPKFAHGLLVEQCRYSLPALGSKPCATISRGLVTVRGPSYPPDAQIWEPPSVLKTNEFASQKVVSEILRAFLGP
jgi:hypothetical protein